MAPLGPPGIVNIEDFRRAAKRRLPRAVFDYIDGGAEDERTLRENSQAFERLTFRPRCAVATPVMDIATSVLGIPISMPVLLGPVGSCRMFYPKGEMAAARAAGDAGTIYALSTLSGCRLEDVKASSKGPVWYQLYLCGGRDVGMAALERARNVGMSALVLTIDTAVAGMRERDLRNGAKQMLSRRVFEMLPYVWQYASRPGWVLAFLRDGGLMMFPNVILPNEGPMAYADVGTALEQSVVTWADLRWIRDAWKGPIVIKGIHTGEDARRAVDEGASAVVVSNHGGRQLDTVRASVNVLPEVVEAVGTRTEVLMDGGIRRGSDVVKALCLGARAVLIGRAYAYALGAAGGDGVACAIDILRAELVRTMKLLGCASIHDLNRSYLDAPQVAAKPATTYA
jgi:isopentenyl diphosphate isomerase/L-lactate dehydrogenase-like FMN-dependent dehydrogenase